MRKGRISSSVPWQSCGVDVLRRVAGTSESAVASSNSPKVRKDDTLRSRITTRLCCGSRVPRREASCRRLINASATRIIHYCRAPRSGPLYVSVGFCPVPPHRAPCILYQKKAIYKGYLLRTGSECCEQNRGQNRLRKPLSALTGKWATPLSWSISLP